MKSFKGSGKISKYVTSAKKTKRTIKRTNPKRTYLKKRYTLKDRISKSTKRVENIIMQGDEDYETYFKTLNGFRVLFKNILKEQKRLNSIINNDKQLDLDIVIDDISDKLNKIEIKGNILKRIRNESQQVYAKVQSMYKDVNTNSKLPYNNLIEYYYEIITKLFEIQNDRNIETKVSDIIALLTIDLTDGFFGKQKIEKEELEDDLSAMFGQLKVSKNSVDDLLEGFSSLKF